MNVRLGSAPILNRFDSGLGAARNTGLAGVTRLPATTHNLHAWALSSAYALISVRTGKSEPSRVGSNENATDYARLSAQAIA